MVLTIAEQLEQIRADALQEGFPADDVERWIATAIPCGTLSPGGGGPVVGRFGGPAMVPRGTRVPGNPLVATIDLAALPRQATDLPLPPDGQLLLFGYPEGGDYYSQGSAMYVPAGVAVEEAPQDEELDEDEDEEFLQVCRDYPQGDIHLTIDVSLPSHTPEQLNPKLIDYWGSRAPISSKWGGVQIGGYASACDFRGNDGPLGVLVEYAGKAKRFGCWNGSGSPSPRVEDWVLLAEFLCSSEMRPGGAAFYWGIQRDDLAARRFYDVYAVVDWNP